MAVPLRVLMLEDRQADAELVAIALGEAGFDPDWRRVDTEADFRAHLDPTLDVILADYNVPGFGAGDALPIVRDSGLDVPFIVVSGTLGDEAAVELLRQGATDYLLKGRLARLGPAVQRALDERRLRQERRASEEELRESEDRFRRLAENAPDMIYRYRLLPASGFEYVSPAATRITGYTPEEHYADPELGLKIVHPDDRELLEQMRVGAVSVQPLVLRWVRKDGAVICTEQHNTPIRDEHGVIVAIEGIARDVTERKQLEEQLLQSQKMDTVGQLAGGMAHDFNNLLTVILGYGQTLAADFDLNDPRRKDLQEIVQAAERAAALTQQLLAFSRRQIRQPVVLDLNAVVADVRKMLDRLIGENIRLVLGLASELKPISADRGQLEQVVMNLAVNARDAMGGGGTLTIETANVRVKAGDSCPQPGMKPGEYVALTVTDTGPGIPPEIQARIFEPFFTTKPRGKGTGLGLSTVHGIVHQSGGTITIESRPGQGATFKLYLPVVESEARDSSGPPAHIAEPRGTETVLVVEDEPQLRDLAKRVLARAGYHVLDAGTAREAVAVAGRHHGPIHLVLSDVVLPDVTGPTLVDEIKQGRPAIKVLYVSGYADDATAHREILVPGVTLLQKPYRPEALARMVRTVLDATIRPRGG